MFKIIGHFSNYQEFRSATNVKEYNKVLGVILNVLGKSQVIEDEHAVKHYVKKEQLILCNDNSCLLPQLDRKILLSNILRKERDAELQFPQEVDDESKEIIEQFVSEKLPFFERSGLESMVFDSEGDPPFSIHFKQSGNKLAIYLEAEGMKSFNLLEGKEKELILHWPEAKLLGLSEEELEALKAYVKENKETFAAYELDKPLKIQRKNESIPLSLLLVPDAAGRVSRIILLPRSEHVGIVGKGSFKEVKYAYDLTRGEQLVKKFMAGKERKIVKDLQDQDAVLKVRAERQKKVDKTKGFQHFEPLATGTLESLITKRLSQKEKMELVGGLLKALKEFHDKSTDSTSNYYHGDIKPANILYKKMPDGSYKVFLSDFGFTNRTSGYAGTPQWISPEHANRWHRKAGEKKIQGQALDVWAMGLLIGSLLKGYELPDRFFSEIVSEHIRNNADKADLTKNIIKKLSFMDQSTMDRFIGKFRPLTRDPQVNKAWNIVQKMLDVDVGTRITAEKALEEFNT